MTILDSVKNIDIGAFIDCSALTSVEAGKGNAQYSSEDRVLFSKNKTELIRFPAGKNGRYTIPDNVTTIGSYAFYDCSSLASMTIPNSVTTIEDWTFFRCGSLTSVTISDNVTSIGYYAFAASGLRSVTIGNSVTSIESFAFLACRSLTSVTIPDSVTSIGYRAFSDCSSLTSITIPDSVISIYHSAFAGCNSLKRITFEGDAPFFLGADVFSNVSGDARIFINSDAIAFGETFEGLPVIILVELKISTFSKSAAPRRPFSKSAAPFSLNFESISGLTYIIEASYDLKQWSEIDEVQAAGSSVEREATFQKQYYRFKLAE